MPTFNIDTSRRRPSRTGRVPAEQAREIVDVLAEADAERVTKTEMHMLEQQLQTGLARLGEQIAQGLAEVQVAQAKSNMRLAGIMLGGIAVATAIIVSVPS